MGNFPSSVAVADVNGDGLPDLVVANFINDDVSVLLGKGDGAFQTQQRFAAGDGFFSICVAIADVNGDGQPDLVAASNVVSILLHQ